MVRHAAIRDGHRDPSGWSPRRRTLRQGLAVLLLTAVLPLLIIGGFIATTSAHALIVLAAFLLPEGLTKAFAILFFMVLFVFCMQLALNIPVWVIISEMFPLRLRGLGMGVCVLCLWVANAVIAFLFPIVVEAIRIEGAFLVFVILGLIAIEGSLFLCTYVLLLTAISPTTLVETIRIVPTARLRSLVRRRAGRRY